MYMHVAVYHMWMFDRQEMAKYTYIHTYIASILIDAHQHTCIGWCSPGQLSLPAFVKKRSTQCAPSSAWEPMRVQQTALPLNEICGRGPLDVSTQWFSH